MDNKETTASSNDISVVGKDKTSHYDMCALSPSADPWYEVIRKDVFLNRKFMFPLIYV